MPNIRRNHEPAPEGQRWCTGSAKIGREPHLTEVTNFHARRDAPDGLSYTCKDCIKAYGAARERDYTAERERSSRRSSRIEREYGITYERYEEMLKEQGGVCAICKRPETTTVAGVIWRLAVDHDHDTGAVRGLLCRACNHGLGQFADDPARLRAAAAYLKAYAIA